MSDADCSRLWAVCAVSMQQTAVTADSVLLQQETQV